MMWFIMICQHPSLDLCEKYNFISDQIYLVGFSQGCMISYTLDPPITRSTFPNGVSIVSNANVPTTIILLI